MRQQCRLPDAAFAEVMDKEPALVVTWAWALVGGALGLVGLRYRWWAGAALALLPAAYFTGLHAELTDPTLVPRSLRKPVEATWLARTAPLRSSSSGTRAGRGTPHEDGLMLPANPPLQRPALGASSESPGR